MSKKDQDSKINIPTKKNKLLKKTLKKVNGNEELLTLWKVINVNAIDRLALSDHGIVHFQIVANIALRIMRILRKNDVEMSLVNDHDLTDEHAEVVVFLASIMHDLGMSISRSNHEEYSLFLANNILREVLDFLPVKERTIITSEALHAIISHREGGKPYTVEAGIVRVSDALDMSEGRSRIPYEAGKIDIHSLSATAINNISISEGKKFPVEINVKMNNSAGIFQVDTLLKSKLQGSGIEKYFLIKAFVEEDKEKMLIKEFEIKG